MSAAPRRWFRRQRTPLVLQTELAECGLACLVMVAGHHGARLDLAAARAIVSVSARGSTLLDLKRAATALGLEPRAWRLEPPALAQVRLPCVLHWNFDHFVVLERLEPHGATILDPGAGVRRIDHETLSRYFTGVVLELAPTARLLEHARRPLSFRMLGDALRRYRGGLAHLLGLTLLLQGLALLGPLQMQWLVDDLAGTSDRGWINALALGFGMIVLLQGGVTTLRGWLISTLGTSLRLRLFSDLVAHLYRLPWSWFSRRQLGDVMSRLQSVETLQRTLGTDAIEAVVDAVMLLLALIMMSRLAGWLVLLPASAAVMAAALRVATDRPLRMASEETLVRGARRATHVMETVRGMQTVKLHGQEHPRAATAAHLAAEEAEGMLRHDRLRLQAHVAQDILFGLESVATLTLAMHLLLPAAGTPPALTLGSLFAFVAYKLQFLARFGVVADRLVEFRLLGVHLHRMADITQTTPEPVDVPGEHAPWPSNGSLALRALRYRYGSGEPAVVDGADLDVRDGECVAIVGASGCGKSTLLKVMLGLLPAESGQVLVGDVDVATMRPAQRRSLFGTVMQDDMPFAGTIAQNIACFAPNPDPARVEECARMAHLHDDVAAMPMGYHTLVGDMGSVMSGGQRQRLLLARALYHRPRILLLDEATSHLDTLTERAVNAALRTLPITRIIVAHRPETIASADRVVALAGGRLHARESARPTDTLRLASSSG